MENEMKLRICEKIAEYEKMGLVKHEFAEGNDFKTYDDILYALYDLFKCYERDITLERRKPFVTDEYENLVKKLTETENKIPDFYVKGGIFSFVHCREKWYRKNKHC